MERKRKEEIFLFGRGYKLKLSEKLSVRGPWVEFGVKKSEEILCVQITLLSFFFS
jgi:hypothetical protein